MTVKNTKPRKSHRIITIKCSNPHCRNEINVSECIENDDIDYLNKEHTKGIVFCNICGSEELVKL